MKTLFLIFVLVANLTFGAMKAFVPENGIYSVSSSNLSAAFGVSEPQISAWLLNKEIRVSNLGQSVPASYSSNSLSFFGKKYESLFSRQNVYFFTHEVGFLGPITNNIPHYSSTLSETNRVCLPEFIYNIAEDPWVGHSISLSTSFGRTNTSTYKAPNILSNHQISVTLFSPYSYASNTVLISLNNQNIATGIIFRAGRTNFIVLTSIVAPQSNNTLKISVVSGPVLNIYIDKYESFYWRVPSSYPTQQLSLSTSSPENLKSQTNSCDYLVIAPTNLLSCAQELVNYRRTNNLSGKVVSLADIYDNFNYGISDPRAIRSFLGYACTKWSSGPRYLVLLGHSSFDYKGYLSSDCMIPPLVALSPTIGLQGAGTGIVGSDNDIADIDGDGSPDLSIGRLPVRDSNEFNRAFFKIKEFERGGSWKTNGLSTAGPNDGKFSFPQEADYQNGFSPKISNFKNYVDQLGNSSTRSNISSKINEGVGAFSYLGEGNNSSLFGAGQTIFSQGEIATSLLNTVRSPFMIGMSCLISDISNPSDGLGNWNISFGEKMIISSNGCVAVLGSGAQVWEGGSYYICRPIISNLYCDGISRIGDAILASLKNSATNGYGAMIGAMNLLGDPATSVWAIDSPRQGGLFLKLNSTYSQWSTWAVPPSLETSQNDDFDGDGASNYDEYLAGTDPIDYLSVLRITGFNGQILKWNAENHKTYEIQSAQKLDGIWIKEGEVGGIWPEMGFSGLTGTFFRVLGK